MKNYLEKILINDPLYCSIFMRLENTGYTTDRYRREWGKVHQHIAFHDTTNTSGPFVLLFVIHHTCNTCIIMEHALRSKFALEMFSCMLAFYFSRSNDWGHIVFVLSVCLLSTLAIALIFESQEIKNSYLKCIFHYRCLF